MARFPGLDTLRARRAPRPRTERVPVALPDGDAPAGNWLRSMRFSGFSVMVLVLLVLTVVVLAPGLRIYLEQRQQLSSLQSAVDAQKGTIAQLQDQRARYDDPAFLKAQVRDRLFYVMPGETSYLVRGLPASSGDDTTTPDGAPISADLQETKQDWVQALLGSALTSALSDTPPDQLQGSVQGGDQ
ncbi:FtsB family cell division protein [Clavibacter phaseoli]|uniref:FtsB family cell division protein n=1 Tax=Clavibacter phaseoli TaxID=1734031 RepID=UPI000E665B4F|nr:septum formation initiator family protein [Clavibacter phaseoli]RIJ56303.1 septum formation initiator family protein [Clavibacter phaseoli]UKF29983.1 septum formation initiator family protein [Clavibacter phaseoli]UKF35901.1 septum formation initiator family protein [Clavibacter phaseoli]